MVAREQFSGYGEPTAFIFKQKIDRNFGPVYIYWVNFGDDIKSLILQIEQATNKINTVQFGSPSEFGAKR